MPIGWNGQLVVFAHGYVAPGQPIAFYNLTLPDGSSLPDVVQSLGFAFATTSYRRNGLAILEGADDMLELVARFGETHSTPLRTYVSAVSEGSLVAALLAERSPDVFFGAFATCGPIGSFNAQIDSHREFPRAVRLLLPRNHPRIAGAIPPTVATNWYSTCRAARSSRCLAANPARAVELLRVAKAPFDRANPSTLSTRPSSLIW
jgi:pimeloyl-ACP methyl ester carboxylesterase